MKIDPKSVAEKAMKGDIGAIEILIMHSPPGHMGGMKDKDYAKKVYDDGGYKTDDSGPVEFEGMDESPLGDEYADKIDALEGVLAPFVLDDTKAAAEAVCRAIKSGTIPGVYEMA
jgi:hypothetical protein